MITWPRTKARPRNCHRGYSRCCTIHLYEPVRWDSGGLGYKAVVGLPVVNVMNIGHGSVGHLWLARPLRKGVSGQRTTKDEDERRKMHFEQRVGLMCGWEYENASKEMGSYLCMLTALRSSKWR